MGSCAAPKPKKDPKIVVDTVVIDSMFLFFRLFSLFRFSGFLKSRRLGLCLRPLLAIFSFGKKKPLSSKVRGNTKKVKTPSEGGVAVS